LVISEDDWQALPDAIDELADVIGSYHSIAGVFPSMVIPFGADPSGSVIQAFAPFGMTQWQWRGCFPVVPTVVHMAALCEYAGSEPSPPMAPLTPHVTAHMSLAFWLYLHDHSFAQGHFPAFKLRRPIDAGRDCNWGHVTLNESAPFVSIAALVAPQHWNATTLLRHSCGDHSAWKSPEWVKAALSPRLCPADVSDPSLGLDALAAVLPEACGAYCQRHRDPTHPGGWNLEGGEGCWRQIPRLAESGCKVWFDSGPPSVHHPFVARLLSSS
jgi:hypothetical protein